MAIIAIPTYLLSAIEERINEFLKRHPLTPEQREQLFQDMLQVVDQTGRIPTINKGGDADDKDPLPERGQNDCTNR